jgi:2-keto-myo-inositol isomerase
VPIHFALNRTCTLQLPLDLFISLAVSVGIPAVEIRNDVEGRAFADGMSAAKVRAKLDNAGLVVASINALQRFIDRRPDRAKEAPALVAYAASPWRAGAGSVPGR